MGGYYCISIDGLIGESINYGEVYILVECGSVIDFDPEKVREVLSKGISYLVNIQEGSLAEVRYNSSIFRRAEERSMENIPSKWDLRDFLERIR